MKRGDFVSVAIPGDFGKPRPALVLQSDRFLDLDTVVVALLTSELVPAALLRATIEPDDENGLRKTSQIMVDKIMTVRREKIGPVFGHLSARRMTEVLRLLGLLFEFG
jgi:mRNA interferase MazF